MTSEQLIAHYPILYHMATEGSWESIRRHGLHSTSSLLGLFEVKGGAREDLEEHHRPETVTIHHPKYGKASIRDQKPMSDAGLRRALKGRLSPRAWYLILNSKVFFWTSEERLHRLLCARAYRKDAHDVLLVQTASVVRAYSDRVHLCPMNSGATKPFPHPRGKDTFRSIKAYQWDGWVSKRGVGDAIVEVAFEDCIDDIANHVSRVVRMRQERVLKTLFER